MRAIPKQTKAFIQKAESCRLTSYLDSVGKWTVGYGHTGSDINRHTKITQAQADAYLNEDIAIAADRLDGVIKPEALVKLNDNQYAALLSFVFNLGCKPDWTIWKRINAGNLDKVPDELNRFVNGTVNGKLQVIPGLRARRAAEVELWTRNDMLVVHAPVPSSVTRVVATPPTPTANVKPQLVAMASTAVLAAPEAIKKGIDTVTPYADKSSYAQHIVEMLATAGAGAALLGVGLLWWQSHRAKH